MKICTAAQMRTIDNSAVFEYGIPSIVLMENAAAACVDLIEKLTPKKIGIFCGKGNNGGDGFAIARRLISKNYDVTVYLVCGEDFSKDASVNYNILQKIGAKIIKLTDTELLEYYIISHDLIVDAIFGTGIKGKVVGFAAEVIEKINSCAEKVLSVDIPSGVNSDSGEVGSVAVKADFTVTFAAYKCGMFLYPGSDFCGKIYINDICIPQKALKEKEYSVEVSDYKLIKSIMPKRRDDSHKGDYGKILIVGGSVGLTGAPTLSALAALRSGAGLVTVGIPKSLHPIMEEKITEAMTVPLAEVNGGLSEKAYETISERMKNTDVLLFGPGCGRDDECRRLLIKILGTSEIPVIIDADGLFALGDNLDILKQCNARIVLTPHEAEFARLIGCDTEEVKNNRLSLSKEFALRYKVTLVLKGHYTIITFPDGNQYINITGNSGMATGGSGDVLAGMLAAFAAVCRNESEAALAAVYFHGLAGDIAAKEYGEISLTAGDIVNFTSDAISKFSTGKNTEFVIQ